MNRNQTVAVAGKQFNPLEQDMQMLRKAERSIPTSFRRGDIEIKQEDLKILEERQVQLKGRQRRGSITLSKTDEVEMSRFWESCDNIELHLHGKLSSNPSDNIPGAEREAVLYKLKEPKLLQEKYKFIYSCVKGSKGYNDTSPNQDNFSYTVFNGWDIIVVMDGHGSCGHRVSTRVVQTLPYYLCHSTKFNKYTHNNTNDTNKTNDNFHTDIHIINPEDIHQALNDAFGKASEDLLGFAIDSDVDIQASGSTCVMFLMKDDIFYSANVGDSRICIGYSKAEKSEVIFETLDHKPSTPGEKERIEASGGEIRTLRYDDFTVDRIFVKGFDYPGLCMARSFGDECVKSCGVISAPEITGPNKIDLNKGAFMVIASDGVWEFIESQWCVKAISKKLGSETAERIVGKLSKEARRRWKQEEGEYCDDITCCLMQLGRKK